MAPEQGWPWCCGLGRGDSDRRSACRRGRWGGRGSGGEGVAIPFPPRLWAVTRGGSLSVLLAALGSCFWPGSYLSVHGGASGPRVLLWPVTLCFPVTPCSVSSAHLREELQLLLQLSEWWHLRPRDGDLPLPSRCRRGPLRGRWVPLGVPLERTGAPPLSSTPSVCLPSPRAGRQGLGGGTEFQVRCFAWGLSGSRR